MNLINTEAAFELNVDQETLLTAERVSWRWRDIVICSSLESPLHC